MKIGLQELKDMIKEEYSNLLNEEKVNEGNIKVVPADKITSKVWRNMKYELRDQIDELVKVGADYGVFQNAQGTEKALKAIKKLMDRI